MKSGSVESLNAMTIYAGGYKSYWRNRTARIAEEWIVPYVRAVVMGELPGALVFPSNRRDSSLALHHDTCASLGLVRTTLHDSRHSFAVQKLRDGWPVTLVAHNLGHQDAYMVFKRYGRFVPNMADFDHFTMATDVAASARTRVK
jgi:integrase